MTLVRSNTTVTYSAVVKRKKRVTYAGRGGRSAARHTRMDRDRVRVVVRLVDPVQAPGRDHLLGQTLHVRLCQHVSQHNVSDTPCVCACVSTRVHICHHSVLDTPWMFAGVSTVPCVCACHTLCVRMCQHTACTAVKFCRFLCVLSASLSHSN